MIYADKVPLKEFDEAACLKYISDSEKLIDLQLEVPWSFGEMMRVVRLHSPEDVRYFSRLKQEYENANWIVSDLFINVTSGGYFATFSRI